jgi:hypothetical protein
MNMKTMMLIASLLSLASGCATVSHPSYKVASRGTLTALVAPAERAGTSYAGIDRVGSSFRDGSHGRSH